VSKFGQNKIKDAAIDFKTALTFNNKDVCVAAAYNLSVASDSLRDYTDAIK